MARDRRHTGVHPPILGEGIAVPSASARAGALAGAPHGGRGRLLCGTAGPTDHPASAGCRRSTG